MSHSELLHPSDLSHAILVYHMIQVSRDEKFTGSKHYLLDIFYYLMKTIAIPRIKLFRSLKVMMRHLRDFLNQDYVDDAEQSIQEYFNEFTSLDTLITFMEDIKTVFELEAQATQNRLIVPNQISNKSILGIFLRKIIATWESMMFEEHCEFYDTLIVFLNKDEPMEMDQEPESWDVENAVEMYVPVPSLIHYIDSLETLLQDGNIAETENIIHNHFDRISSNPLLINFAAEDWKSIPKQLQELKELEAGRGAAGNWLRHQHAMMNLAIMWISAKNYEMAQSAIEEALKTAHQRGDHPSVVKCLLLLFHVLQHSEESEEGSSEELLVRCISKSGVLGLSDLVNEAVIIFAKTKMRSLKGDVEGTPLDSDNSKATLTSSSNSQEWSFQNIYNLLSFAVHGEMSLTVKYCLTRTVTNLDDTSAATGNMMATAKQQSTVSEKINVLDEKYTELYFNATFILAELWHRVAKSQMSSISCRRAMELFGTQVKDHLYIKMVSKLIFSMLCELFQDVNSKYAASIHVFDSLKDIYETYMKLQEGLTSRGGSTAVVLDVTSNYLYAFLSLSQGEWQRASRFAQKVVAIIDSSSDSIEYAANQGVYDDSVLMLEDKVRCKAMHILLSAKASGVEKDVVLESMKQLVTRHHCVYIMQEDSIVWMLNRLYHL